MGSVRRGARGATSRRTGTSAGGSSTGRCASGRLWIGPPWEEPPADADAIVVDPGRAFGTGGHATTRLCLELLADLERGSLLDVGCGSGVLSIAAARLGFAPVVALDHDPAALEATARNAAANAVELEVLLADALVDPLPAADVAVANISRTHRAARAAAPGIDGPSPRGTSSRTCPRSQASDVSAAHGGRLGSDLFLREE